MRTRILTGVIFTIAVLAFVVPAYWFSHIMILFAVIVGAVATKEMISALKAGGNKPCTKLIVFGDFITLLCIAGGLFIKNNFLTVTVWALAILSYCFFVAILPQLFDTDVNKSLKSGLISGGTILYVNYPLFCLMAASVLFENGWFYMVPALFAPWVTDTCAYFSGVLLGKHKIVPHISPKKTWEGCIGGLLFCGVFFLLYFGLFVYNIENIEIGRGLFMVLMFVFGAVVSAMSQIGDWLASSIKRVVGIKDYGKFMPGHGGMLDRFDSAFFTLPFGLVLAVISCFIK